MQFYCMPQQSCNTLNLLRKGGGASLIVEQLTD